jgi:hypothetical protein
VPVLKFADWTPDAADLGSSGAITVTNALPSRDGYKPFKALSIVTGALSARPRGAIEDFDSSNDSYQYAGDETNLYELDTTTMTWTDISGATYTTGATEVWEFVRWENKILATNFSDSPQQITFGAANFSNLTTDLKARHIAVVRDFVVVGNTYDASDGNVPNRVRWSAIGNETSWTVSASTLADFRDLTTGGAIQKVLGGEVGIIVSQRSVFRMTWVGAPTVFQIDEVLPDIGAIAAGTVCRLGDSVYFISDHGFVELTGGGTGVNQIGAGRVDEFFSADLDPDFLHRISCIADPTSNRIAWAYPGTSNTDGTPNKIIIYDRTFGKWSMVEEEVELLLRAKGIGLTLEELDGLGYTDIDTMDVSLDSDLFKATASQFAAFDSSFEMGFFRGLNKTAVLVTQESEIFAGYNAQVNAFRPLVDLGTVTARVGTRARLSDSVSYGGSLSQSSSGNFDTRSDARYHRFELTITGNDWTDALGVQLDAADVRRGTGRA